MIPIESVKNSNSLGEKYRFVFFFGGEKSLQIDAGIQYWLDGRKNCTKNHTQKERNTKIHMK